MPKPKKRKRQPIQAGTYRLTMGDGVFYVGSSWNLARRRASHISDLRSGVHPVPALQAAWDAMPEVFTFSRLHKIPRHDGESDNSHRARLRQAEQTLLDQAQGNPLLANRSPKASGPIHGAEVLRAKWKQPAYRARMMEILRNRTTSPETRAKMGEAKRGARNVHSRPVLVTWPDGRTDRHETATEAAQALQVTQQLVSLWVAGKVSQPGEGRRLRKRNAWLAGARITYAE